MAKDTLEKYRAKRDFKKTPEPTGIRAQRDGFSYLIQKHAASHLHYDFRLELDGALKSWAVPKGPSYDPKDRRLAMEVEDHPVTYGSFEGTIPKGQYGGGTVMLWDRGTWEPVGDPRAGLRKGKLVFKLYGERLHGEWTLVRFHGRDDKRNHWFLIKHRDEEVIEGDNGQFVQENATSVVSGRTMDEIAAAGDKVWQSNRAESKEPVKKSTGRFVAKSGGKISKKFPGFISPQLATLSTAVPNGKEWVHEIKFDGYRMLGYIENGEARLISRNNKDWTDAFAAITGFAAQLPVKNAIVDGEVVTVGKNNRSDFSELKNALSSGKTDRMQYYLFDLLFLNGEDLRTLPLLERKARLEAVIQKLPSRVKNKIIYSEHFTDEKGDLFQGVCSMHLEGVVSKRVDAPYMSERAKAWLKTKCIRRQEFVIGGYTLPTNGSLGVGALLLGYYDGDRLEYAGRVGTGWKNDLSLKLRKALDKFAVKDCPYESITTEGRRKAKWVKPRMVCEVEFTEWTPDGHLRHPSFEGLREDKGPKEVTRDFAEPVAQAVKEAREEVAVAPAKMKGSKKVKAKSTAIKAEPAAKSDHAVGGITISHPDRVIYPKSHITKQQLAEYYLAIAGYILPHIEERPISMLRCPDGATETCFYQRHVGMGKSPHLHEVEITVKGTKRSYLMIKDVKGLISLVQWGVIEIHPWQCAANNLARPDRIIFDLDPDPSVPFERLIEAAREVKKRMEELGLESFLKTTGGKGLHVVIPLMPAYGWTAIKSFARAIAESMATDNPDRYLSKISKAARKGRIFIDYLRNDVTSTAVAPFSARAREGATVSTPLDWSELKPSLKMPDFTVESVLRRLKKKKDPWAEFFKVKQKIDAKYLRALKIDPA